MELLGLGEYNLHDLDRYNIVVGKNGCGKSRLLKAVETALRSRDGTGVVRYISPERAGTLLYDPNVDHQLTQNMNWLADSRRKNQAEQFRQQSAAQFRKLELLVLREIEQDSKIRRDETHTFNSVVDRINTLLDRVYIKRGDQTFEIWDRRSNQIIGASDVSSGESELISLGIECLVFARECVPEQMNMLLLDEPDVHLHPDLQARFGRFILTLLDEAPITVILATHSTAFLGSAGDRVNTRLAFMRYGDHDLTFTKIDYAHKRVLPVFGAHPLSNVFNEAPVLLVEGDDDERIWQQAVRSSEGKIALYPVAVDSVTSLNAFETEVARILEAVYDDAVGYSLRDGDSISGALENVGPVRRFRLNCRAAENLLLADEVLSSQELDWETLKSRIQEWIAKYSTHPHFSAFQEFAEGSFDRRNGNLKDIRNDLVGLMNSNKPWEVLVGQALAACAQGKEAVGPDNLRQYIGEETFNILVLDSPIAARMEPGDESLTS